MLANKLLKVCSKVKSWLKSSVFLLAKIYLLYCNTISRGLCDKLSSFKLEQLGTANLDRIAFKNIENDHIGFDFTERSSILSAHFGGWGLVK